MSLYELKRKSITHENATAIASVSISMRIPQSSFPYWLKSLFKLSDRPTVEDAANNRILNHVEAVQALPEHERAMIARLIVLMRSPVRERHYTAAQAPVFTAAHILNMKYGSDAAISAMLPASDAK